MSEELKLDETSLKVIKITQDKDLAVEALARKPESFDTSIKFVLERIKSNMVENQISDVANNYESYELKADKLVRRIDLPEYNVNQFCNKRLVVLGAKLS